MKKVLCVMLFISGCMTSPEGNKRIFIEESDYKSIVLDSTENARAYEGLNNVLEIHATLLNSKVLEAQTLRKATNFQWSDAEIANDRAKNSKLMATETNVFISFFTPEHKDDNLNKPDTVWRIFLDVNSKRYSGTAQRLQDTPTEILDLYPEHTKWGTPYMVKFLVPTSTVESTKSRLTVTGPLGSTYVDF